MKKVNLFKSSSGFTLAEVMISAGIVGVISVAVMQLTGNLFKSTRYTNQSMTANSLRATLYTSLRSKNACQTTFAGAVVTANANLASIAGPGGGAVITSGAVFGDPNLTDASGRITITDIHTENYQANGAAYRSDPTLGATDRQNATVDLVVVYKRGDYENKATTDADEKAKTLGSITNELRIPVQLVHDTAGSVVTCDTESNTYTKALCDSLQGELNTDGFCRHITVEDDLAPNSDYAATFKGNVNIEASNITPTANDLRVDGSVGIGRDPVEYAGQGGYMAVKNSIVVGASPLAPPNVTAYEEPGVGFFNNSLGVGRDADAAKGSITVGASIAIGSTVAYPGGDGNASVQKSLGVGVNPAARAAGEAHINNSIGVGSTRPPFANAGSLRAGSLIIDSGTSLADPGAGNIVVSGYVHIPNQTESQANTPTHAATMGWVARKIADTITPAIGNLTSVYNDILSSNPSEVGFAQICQGMQIQSADGSYTVGVYSAGRCNFDLKHCTESGVCNAVYAGTGGVTSIGNITSTNGNITANLGNISAPKAGATISAPNGTVSANRVSAASQLCLNGNCKSNWEQINIGTSSCVTVSAGNQCSSGYFISRINTTTTTVQYVSNVTPNYYNGSVTSVSVAKSTSPTLVTGFSYSCCKAVNLNP
ncbi:type II secretion system protein [Bacteriovorax sp. Seq25_V]|uniref:type IV pilus modification PilV family protein n=1 Tax=Bacteriovorax sp. Seq25_V TaxID=1201288 RepID=UPI00038A327B|nr:type II secretion system protein [Bacteriovorax sp. Seq25_V]EQC46780.1 hypothetical protein M900_2588 [Bacteriovorax sp. Seq25_V]